MVEFNFYWLLVKQESGDQNKDSEKLKEKVDEDGTGTFYSKLLAAGTTIFAKDFDMNKLLKFLWRGQKQGRCGRSPMLKIEKYAHIYLVFAHAR